jgi:nicotinate-nucleotide adenylyltransferase
MGEMVIERKLVDEVWFIVSPESPYKTNTGTLALADDRYAMVKKAVSYNPRFSANDIEFDLAPPSYTYITLQKLKRLYPTYEFHIICGTDVYVDIPNWYGGKDVIEACKFIVYPRNNPTNYAPQEMKDKTIWLEGVPSLEISATFLRNQIKNNGTTKHLLPESIQDYISENNLYK